MALFQRRPQVSDPTNYYSVGLNKTVLLVGLGNPGEEYELTRHNAGFIAIDAFVNANSEMEPWIGKKTLKAEVSTGRIGETRVIAIKPTTFMNLSGEAVQAVAQFYKIPPDSIVVIHDELDVDFGNIRLRQGGGSAGHNGIKSVTQHIGENYGRIRIGIGPKDPERMPSESFVLQDFSPKQQEQLPNMIREVNAILSEYIFGPGDLPQDTRSFLI